MSCNPISIPKRRNRFLLVWKALLFALLSPTLFTACGNSPATSPPSHGTSIPQGTPTSTASHPSSGLLPGQAIWKKSVSSYLFGTNDSVDYSNDNFVTDPHHIIQSSLKSAGFQIMREFIFHYSIIDGHRTTLGTNPQIQLDRNNPHEYDTPAAQQTTVTPNAPYGYELETRVKAIENSGMQCMIVLPSIWTDPSNPTDPFTLDHIYTNPATGKVETDLDFDKQVAACVISSKGLKQQAYFPMLYHSIGIRAMVQQMGSTDMAIVDRHKPEAMQRSPAKSRDGFKMTLAHMFYSSLQNGMPILAQIH